MYKVLIFFTFFNSQYGKTGSMVSVLSCVYALEADQAAEKEEALEADQTLDALETLMAMENLPNLSNIFVAGWYSGIGEFCKVLDSLHRLESHKTERDSTLRYHAFAENAPPEPFPG